MTRSFIAIALFITFLFSCKDKTAKKEEELPRVTKDSVVASNKDSVLLQLTNDILTEIKRKNYSALANFIDPVAGIRFSPYGFVDTVSDKIFSKEEFVEQVTKANQNKFVWGESDGSGEPINMTLNEYIQKFVYDVDFVKPEKQKANAFIGGGNSLNNLLTVYRGCDFTESHFSGFEKKYEGMDWRSLRLVFKEKNGKFLLVGIVHDQWTI
ncbi:MAG: hypothetical protein ACHQFX_06325 [Chitinophagales bacterium]